MRYNDDQTVVLDRCTFPPLPAERLCEPAAPSCNEPIVRLPSPTPPPPPTSLLLLLLLLPVPVLEGNGPLPENQPAPNDALLLWWLWLGRRGDRRGVEDSREERLRCCLLDLPLLMLAVLLLLLPIAFVPP